MEPPNSLQRLATGALLLTIAADLGCWLAVNPSNSDASTTDGPSFPLVPQQSHLVAGQEETCAIRDGGLYCWGVSHGGLTGQAITRPARVLDGVNGAAVADFNVCAVMADGHVQCQGLNESGQLGDGTRDRRTMFGPVVGISDAVDVFVGCTSNYACVLARTGTIACFGSNDHGQLGDGTTISRSTPVAVLGIADARSLGLGATHACAAKADGSVWCWGQSNLGSLASRATEGTDVLSPVRIPNMTDAIQVVSGDRSSCARRANGRVTCWGFNDNGQLGHAGVGWYSDTPVDVDGLTDAVKIFSYLRAACALRSNGSLRCWSNAQWALGGCAERSPTVTHLPPEIAAAEDVEAIATGICHSCVLRSGGGVQCWGPQNNSGQLGNGTTTPSLIPQQVAFP